jgi:hypothetical protein
MADACHDVNHSPKKSVNISSLSTFDLLNCELLKSEINVLRSEIKSLSEIINILNNERESVATDSKNNTTSSCSSCAQLENKLKESEEEINSLKLIIELLKTDKHVPQEKWTTVTTTTANRASNLTSQSNMMQDMHGASGMKQYSVPLTNRFAVLTDRSGPSYGNFSTRISRDNALKHPARKTSNVNSSSSHKIKESWTPLGNYDSIENEMQDGNYTIPSIVNGVTSEPIPVKLLSGYNPESKCTLKDANKQHINKIKEDISNHKKCDKQYDTPHKIVLIGDSHLRGFSSEIQFMLNKGYECVSIVKPGATKKTLSESSQETVKKLTQNDLLVFCGGTNDLEFDKFDSIFQNVRNFLSTANHTNCLLLGIPFRYDLGNFLEVNCKIHHINKKLQKLTRVFPHTSFLEIVNDRKLFTNHGLHQSILGKKLTYTKITRCILTIFQCKTLSPLPLKWHDIQNERESIETKESNHSVNRDFSGRTFSRNKKTPVTRTGDFLWEPTS